MEFKGKDFVSEIRESEFRDDLMVRIHELNQTLPKEKRVPLDDETIDDIVESISFASQLLGALNYKVVLVSKMA